MGGSARRRIAALALGLVLGAACGEWFMRAHFPLGTRLYAPDDELLFTTVPGARRVLVLTDGTPRLTELDERGHRIAPDPAANAPNARGGDVVAVYGDSLVIAENSDAPDTFVARLAAELSELRGHAVRTVNGGASGYGPDQAWLRFERERDELGANELVLVLCAHNDLGDLVRNRLFRLEAGGTGSLMRGAPRLSDELVASFEDARAKASRPAWIRLAETLRSVRERRKIRDGARGPVPHLDLYLMAATDDYEDAVLAASPVVTSLFRDYYDVDVILRPRSEPVRYKLALLTALLREARASCERAGVRLTCVVVPSAADLVEDVPLRVDPALYPSYEASALTDAYVAACGKAGVAVVDLFDAFRSGGPAALFVGGHDFHWNEHGQAMAARRVAEAIEAR